MLARKVAAATGPGEASWPGMTKILIVEDESIVAQGMSLILSEAGHRVVGIADDRSSALAKADRYRPELVLMDIALARNSDGIEVARDLRDRLGVAVVFISAHLDARTRERAAALGAAGCLDKPYSPSSLLAAVAAAGPLATGG